MCFVCLSARTRCAARNLVPTISDDSTSRACEATSSFSKVHITPVEMAECTREPHVHPIALAEPSQTFFVAYPFPTPVT